VSGWAEMIFQEGTSTSLLPPTFRAYGYRTFAGCQYTSYLSNMLRLPIEYVEVTVEAQAQKVYQ